MTELIFNYNTGEERVQIPTSWDDITFSRYCDLLEKDNGNIERRISILTGLREADIKALPAESVLSISSMLNFALDLAPIKKASVIPEAYQGFDIGLKPWGLYEEAKKAISVCREGDHMRAAIDIVKIYTRKDDTDTGKDISDMPVLGVLGEATFFLGSWIGFTNGTRVSPQNTHQSKSRRGSRKSRRSASSVPSMPSPTATR